MRAAPDEQRDISGVSRKVGDECARQLLGIAITRRIRDGKDATHVLRELHACRDDVVQCAASAPHEGQRQLVQPRLDQRVVLVPAPLRAENVGFRLHARDDVLRRDPHDRTLAGTRKRPVFPSILVEPVVERFLAARLLDALAAKANRRGDELSARVEELDVALESLLIERHRACVRPEAVAGGRVHRELAQKHRQKHTIAVVDIARASRCTDQKLERRVEKCGVNQIRGGVQRGDVNAAHGFAWPGPQLLDTAERRPVLQAALRQCGIALVGRHFGAAPCANGVDIHGSARASVRRADLAARMQRPRCVCIAIRRVHLEPGARVVESELHERARAIREKERTLEGNVAHRNG